MVWWYLLCAACATLHYPLITRLACTHKHNTCTAMVHNCLSLKIRLSRLMMFDEMHV